MDERTFAKCHLRHGHSDGDAHNANGYPGRHSQRQAYFLLIESSPANDCSALNHETTLLGQILSTQMPSPHDMGTRRRDAPTEELNLINVAPAPVRSLAFPDDTGVAL